MAGKNTAAFGIYASRAAAETAVNALRERLFDLRKKGFGRLFQNGQIFEFATPESLLDIDFSQPVYALIEQPSLGWGDSRVWIPLSIGVAMLAAFVWRGV